MPGEISVQINSEQWRDLNETLASVKNGAERACNAAINRTLTTGRSRIVKRIANELNLTQTKLREVVTVKKSTFGTLAGTIRLVKKPIPLIDYDARQTATGITVKVRRNQAPETHDHYFVATLRSGHESVFARRKAGAGRVARLPIDEMYGPSLLGVFENAPGIAEEELDALGEVLAKNLGSQIDRLLHRQAIHDE